MSEGAFGPAVGCRSGGAQTRGGGAPSVYKAGELGR